MIMRLILVGAMKWAIFMVQLKSLIYLIRWMCLKRKVRNAFQYHIPANDIGSC